MSSIWTPGGEHVPADDPPAGTGAGPGAPPPGAELDEEQVREALAQLAATPVSAILADHAIRLHELAVLHLGLSAERVESLGEAALAIDGMAALVDGLGDRLGDAARPLADALAQLRVAFVQVAEQRPGADAGAGADPE